MALDTSPANLMREVKAAMDATAEYLHDLPDRIQRYLGPGVRIPGIEPTNYGPELASGHSRQMLTLMLPNSVQRAPVTRGTSRQGEEFDLMAEAVGAALTTLSREDQDEIALRDSWTDYFFGFSAVRVAPEERDEGRFVPGAFVEDPACVFWDTRAESARAGRYKGPRFIGHKFVMDHEDLIALAEAENERDDEDGTHDYGRWEVETIRAMEPMTGARDRGEGRHPDRREVEAYEVWVPEIQLDEDLTPRRGFNGTIYTIAKGPNATDNELGGVEIRKPRPYYGPPQGPYVFIGCWPVPRSMFPLSPQMATDYDEQQLDAHLSAAGKAMREYKRIVIVPKGMGNHYQGLPDGTVIEVAGLDPRNFTPVTIELAGITPQHLEHLAVLRDHVARAGGLDAAQTGMAPKGVTATATAVVDARTEARLGFVEEQFRAGVREIQTRKAWFMLMDSRMRVPINLPEVGAYGIFYGGEDDPDDLGPDERALRGPGEPIDLVAALEIDLETDSMGRPGRGLRAVNTMQAAQFVLSTVPMVRQFPEVEWDKIFNAVAAQLDVPELAEPVNLEMAFMLAGVQAQPTDHKPARLPAAQAGAQRAGLEMPRVSETPRGPKAGAQASGVGAMGAGLAAPVGGGLG